MSDDLYVGREQSFVKHLILRNYLQRFAQIIGQRWPSITYVDCFAGPWQSKSDDLSDTSFGIAVSELRKARLSLSQTFQRNVKIRAFFLEEDKEAYERLNAFAKQQFDMEIMTLNLRLEDAVSEIVDFIKSENDTFPFILIDPKGWSGFDIEVIKPLLKLRPGEVLVNFMIEHIRRFVEWDKETNKNSFVRLFGSESFLAKIYGLQPSERDDVIAQTYLETLKSVGEFEFGSMALVLHPEHDRRFFYLPYVTRNPKGIEVFKDAEQRTMPAMEQLRARASQRIRVTRTSQRELFGTDDSPNSTYFEDLRVRYLTAARDSLYDRLQVSKRLRYDDAWSHALQWPMVWDSDLKTWISEWSKDGVLGIEGLKPRERVPKLGAGHYLCLRDSE